MSKRSGAAMRSSRASPRGWPSASFGLLLLLAVLAVGGRPVDGRAADGDAPPGATEAPAAEAPMAEPGTQASEAQSNDESQSSEESQAKDEASPKASGGRADAARSTNRPASGGGGRLGVEARLQRLTVGLRLTADQQVKVRAILEKRQAQALQIHSTQALSAVDQFRKYQALDKQTVESIRSVLTEQQRLKYQPPHAHGPAPAGGQPPRAAPH